MTIFHSAFEHNFRRFALCYCVFVYKIYVFFRADVCYNKNAEREKEKNPERQILKKDGTTMNINIIGKQVTIRDDMKALAEKKLAKFDRYFPEGADAVVTVRREEKDQLRVETTISVGGTLFRAEESSSEFKNALTRCVELIEGQIRKNKTRLEKRMKTSFAAAEAALAVDSAPVPEEGEFEIRKKTFLMKPMTPEEAILQMNLLGHTFYVFEDAENGEMCVVYKRNAGSYGLIVPDKQKA